MSKTDQSQIFNLLQGKWVTYNGLLTHTLMLLTGRKDMIKVSLFLGQLIYLQGSGTKQDPIYREGFIYKTDIEAFEEYGLTRPELDRIRKILIGLELITVKSHGQSRKHHYLVDVDKLAGLIIELLNSGKLKRQVATNRTAGNRQYHTYTKNSQRNNSKNPIGRENYEKARKELRNKFGLPP